MAINDALADEPEQINEDPYHIGWLYKLMPEDPRQLDTLLSAAAYRALHTVLE